MKYKAVIFDLFGTLIKNFPWDESNSVLRRMALELSAPPDDFTALWHATFDKRMKGVLKDYQACIRHICQQLGAQVQDDRIELAASTRFEMNKQEVTAPREGAIEVLSYLKANGCKTGLISNCSTETTLVWGNSPLAPLIDVALFSCLVGLMKPDPRIYQMAVERLAVKPEECMYIADGMEQELLGASKLGMRAILIRVPGESDYDPYREEWDRLVISSLKEVLTLVE
jgi:putative hydrolase of the HAD superfamily